MSDRAREQFSDNFELFQPTGAGILAWVRTTRPTPPREDVEAYVSGLASRGLIGESDLLVLAEEGYRVPTGSPS